jgi:hypothetical protein
MPSAMLLVQLQVNVPPKYELDEIKKLVSNNLVMFKKEYGFDPESIEVNPAILIEAYKGVSKIGGVRLTSNKEVFRHQVRFSFDESLAVMIDKRRKSRNMGFPTGDWDERSNY